MKLDPIVASFGTIEVEAWAGSPRYGTEPIIRVTFTLPNDAYVKVNGIEYHYLRYDWRIEDGILRCDNAVLRRTVFDGPATDKARNTVWQVTQAKAIEIKDALSGQLGKEIMRDYYLALYNQSVAQCADCERKIVEERNKQKELSAKIAELI